MPSKESLEILRWWIGDLEGATSFPFKVAARKYDVPYGDVLRWDDKLPPSPNLGAYSQWQIEPTIGEQLLHDRIIAAVLEARCREATRRTIANGG